jgi:thiol-disulfide isomerase/thioredoxin
VSRLRRVVGALLVVVVLAGCAAGGRSASAPDFRGSGFAACPPPAAGSPAPVAGNRSPDAAAGATLPAQPFACMDGGGARVRLDRPVGVPMVVNLWAPWCGPCAQELPAFQRLYADATGRVLVLGVVTDADAAQSVAAAKDIPLRFPNVYDRERVVLRGLHQAALPVTVFVGADGKINKVYKGGVLTDAALRGLVRTHLGVDVR